MANMAMAQAVLEHAHQFYDVGSWYVVAECWDVFSVLEELDQQEERTNTRFELDDGAISHFAQIIAAGRGEVEFVLLGAGAVNALPPRPVREALQRAGIGLEFMDTPSACRTYNILTAEGRKLAAALIAV